MSTGTTVAIASQDWTLGPRIGSGGFGEVYVAESRGRWGAIKLIPKDRHAGRDLLFADNLQGAKNVIPVFGWGETDTHWALLMPKAEQSLRDYLNDLGKVPEAQALVILTDIAQALVSLGSTGVIHRDIKPENILLQSGSWCLSDFGISRYVDATTATETWKYSTTRAYAAPEQWRDQSTTPATDVYAHGIVAYELLTGSRPFPGPEPHHFRDQHLHWDPPLITTIGPALAALIEECLLKAPGARPTPQNLLSRLGRQTSGRYAGQGHAKLEEANRRVTASVAAQGRRESEALTDRDRRSDLYAAAKQQFSRLSSDLRAAIMSAAPNAATRTHETAEWLLTLGTSTVRLSKLGIVVATRPERNQVRTAGGWALWTDPARLPFDVIAFSDIAVDGQSADKVSRAHSLWFCDAEKRGQFSWYELAFSVDNVPAMMDHPSYVRLPYNPQPLHPNEPFASDAFSPSPTYATVVVGPRRLVSGRLEKFIDRWAGRLATAQITAEPPDLAASAANECIRELATAYPNSSGPTSFNIPNPEDSALIDALIDKLNMTLELFIDREGPLRKRIRSSRAPGISFLEISVWFSPPQKDGSQIVLYEEHGREHGALFGAAGPALPLTARLLKFPGGALMNGRPTAQLQAFLEHRRNTRL